VARRLVIDLADARPIFSVPASFPDRVRAAAPDWDVRVVDAPADGTGDGSTHATPEALAAVRQGAEVYLGFGVPADLVREGRDLRWIHTGVAGVGAALSPELLAADAVFTNSAGVHGPPVAETVIGYLLHFARGFDIAVRNQALGRWDKSAFDRTETPVRELSRSTVGVVGLGGIGREVAWRAEALGARVVATRRRRIPTELEGVELWIGPGSLNRLLEESDYVVLTVPETPETTGMIDAAALARMGPDTVLVNVARGGLVDTTALVAALEAGRLRGAALDAFTAEPVPRDDPLWTTPHLLITPHVSAYTHAFWERESELILDNFARFREGRELRNVVDRAAGY
jgi:phosphoglycerate dehydrogenase-like enzyme